MNIETGLPHSDVSTITQDNYGFIWLGTPNGLCRYDGKELISVNEFSDARWNDLRDARIIDLGVSSDSLLLASCYGEGLVSIDLSTDELISYTEDSEGMSLPMFSRLLQSKSGIVYLCSEKGLYSFENGILCHTQFREAAKNASELSSGEVVVLSDRCVYCFAPSDGTISTIIDGEFTVAREVCPGILCLGSTSGLYLLDTQTQVLQQVSHDHITSIAKDYTNNFWVGTRQTGLLLYDNSFKLIRQYDSRDRLKKYRLSNNLINYLFADNIGNLWVGTMDGLLQISLNVNDFQLFDVLSYSYLGKRIKGICEYDENVIVSTLDGSVDIWDKSFTSKLSLVDYTDNLVPSITVLKQTSDGSLLLGGEGGISVLRKNAVREFLKKPYRMKAESLTGGFFIQGHITVIEEDKEGGFWVGTNQGLFYLRPDTTLHTPYHVIKEESCYFFDCLITSLLVATDETNGKKRIWVGTRSGLKYIDISQGREEVIDYALETDNLFFKNSITSIIACSSGDIALLNISDGLTLISEKDKWSDYFVGRSVTNRVMNNVYETLIEDNAGNFWIGGIGLLKWSPVHDSFRYYSPDDGIINRSFKVRSAYKLKSGEIMMAGLNSVDVFNPEDIKDYTSINSKAVFTNLKISGVDVSPGQVFSDGSVILSKNINETPTIYLSYRQNSFSVSFIVLDYQSKHNYKYILKGAGEDFIYCSNLNNEARFSNLHPGKYRLNVYYTENNLVWKDNPISLDVIIRPPFYLTPLAYVIYLIVLGSMLYLAIRFYQKRLQRRNAALLAEVIREEERKSNDLKLKYVADISHEIKTPLTLVYSPLSEVLGANSFSLSEIKTKLSIAMKNVERLKLLAESLIDLEKQNIDYSNLTISKVDVVAFCEETVSLFQDIAYAQNVDLKFVCKDDVVWGYFDAAKIEKVLFNLIGNAFKFTPRGGKISVGIEDKESSFKIYVEDNGVGISENNQKRIFERYYRVLNTDKPGSGIGLAMSDAILRNHQGKLDVQSEEGKGSRFTISLKKGYEHYADPAIINRYPLNHYSFYDASAEIAHIKKDDSKHILVVDDNTQMRDYLKNALEAYYTVYVADNGKDALSLAAEKELDLVLSDIVMPEIDGFQLCEALKSNIKTSHIPVLLVSAQGQSHMQIKGYASKADAFIEKPFNMNVLQAKIYSVLEQRQRLMESLRAHVGNDTESYRSLGLTDLDKEFIDSIISIIEQHLDREDFGVDNLAREIGMSRPVLYRKVKALSGMSIIEFVRHIKLHKAEAMLRSGKYNVSETMYLVGFNSMSYFSKVFKKEFGYLPRRTRNRNNK